MTKRNWHIVGLIVCIVLYVLVFDLAIVNYQVQIKYLYSYKQYPIFETQRNIILILNPFWIGVVIFGVLLAKTKSQQGA